MNTDEKVYPSGQHYSGTNRIPNIKQFVESLDRQKKQRDAQIDAQLRASSGHGEAQDHVSAAQQQQQKRPAGKNRRTVRDPVTGRDVEIEDIDTHHMKAADQPTITIPNANLGKPTTRQTLPTQSGEEYRAAQDETAPPAPVAAGATTDVPIHGEKTNVLFHPTPAVSYEPMFAAVEARANVLCAGLFLAVVLLGRALGGGSLWALVPLGAGVASAVFLWAKDLIGRGRATEWSAEQRRGETAVVNLIPESVEWLNTALGLIWGLVNPDMFAAVADTLEDVMQASVPGVVENVKVNGISQGSNPLRILSLRALPESYMQDLKEEIHKRDAKGKDPQELAAEEEGGEFYNLEATIAYHALPSSADVSSKARNMGMQLIFYLGVKGLFGVPFPIWVELNRLVATARLRVELAPNPPFVKTLSFTLMGLPKVEASCIPLVEKGANILNLPVIFNFVNWAIATVANMYVAPKSMTLDVGKMLQGDNIKKDTIALGVLFIRIHRATGLSKQDRRGSEGGGSDPYICVSFSKFGKPQYCTRVIQDDLNPIFSECCALPLTADVIRVDEQLSLELWDSDRSSADDVVGKVELSIQKLIQHPGRMFPQVSRLRGVKAGSAMPGELHWEVGFFGKTQFRRALRTDGLDPKLPAELRDRKELQDERGSLDTAEEDAVVHTPPDPLWPSGILSVVVHQIVNLELENVKGSRGGRRTGGREYEPARAEAGEIKEEQGKRLPSAYCTVLINDELVYKTRTKVVSSRPIFEAGTERFVRDWRSCIVTVTVRDSRHRQHDPIIGVVPLRLSDVLQTSSQSTRWYPLDGGIGFGRIRLSLLFRSVELRLPPTQLGFGEIGTFEFLSDAITASGYCPTQRTKLRLRTGGSSATVKSDVCRKTDDGTGLTWDISGSSASSSEPSGKHKSTRIRLPVRYRYRSPVFFEFRPAGRRRKPDTFASVWLQDVPDAEERDFDIPIWRCNNGTRLSQNYITPDNVGTVPDLQIAEIGRLRFRGRFKPGTDRDHLRFVSDNDSRETIETWEACFAEGVRAEHVRPEVPPTVQRLHEESLTHGRDVLAMAPEEDKRKWLAKDGTDWSGAFGGDPAALLGEGRSERRDEGADGVDGEVDGPVHEEEESSSGEDEDEDEEVDLGINDATSAKGKERQTIEGSDEGEEGNYTWKRHGSEGTNGARGSVDSAATRATGTTGKTSSSKNPIKQYREYRSRSRDLHRKHRGLMQWKPMRSAQFAKDEALFAARRLMKVGSLSGRTPDVETEV
ncbi:dd72ee82-fbca-4bc3-8468-06269e0ff8fc [Thermothielavioides terrestris]|uniref:Dd72ee82-fbca-4bc3-8468-06269e0ff8fc n=1 Tax=Thermothielavioides terrestris TaxID=2587410 RepID=A0A3S4DB12_9PEZI|nr:dd72ee82-fbca-4bc3-8468-06269e0ff8fc [Thermothielavioides terrestris]